VDTGFSQLESLGKGNFLVFNSSISNGSFARSIQGLGAVLTVVFGLLFPDNTIAGQSELDRAELSFGAVKQRSEINNPLINFLESHDRKSADAETRVALARAIETLGQNRSAEAPAALIRYLDFPDPKLVIAEGVIRASPNLERLYPAIKAMISIGRPSFYPIIDALARDVAGTSTIFGNAVLVLIRIEGGHPHGRELLRVRLELLLKTDPYPGRRAVYESIIHYLES
jgi:hypothetical protein